MVGFECFSRQLTHRARYKLAKIPTGRNPPIPTRNQYPLINLIAPDHMIDLPTN